MPGPPPTAPHGTVARARRHYRNGETPCDACQAAQRQAAANPPPPDQRQATPRAFRPLPMPKDTSNGMPEPVPYRWRAVTYPWAVRVLRNAEAALGCPPIHPEEERR